MVEVDMNLGNLPADKYEDIKAADQARVAVSIKLDSGNLRNQDTITFVFICRLHDNKYLNEGPLASYVTVKET